MAANTVPAPLPVNSDGSAPAAQALPGAVNVPGAGAAVAAGAAGVPRPLTYQSASLYVGDLAPDVTESHLFEVFNSVAPVASIRVCRNAVTRASLGYAYVNFHTAADAERVLDTMNYTPIKGRSCRIMWSHRDPSLRKTGRGNVFIKNLDESIDHKMLHDTFSIFGNILSCKVATDRITGKSKGYGFVHYEKAEEAEEAIRRVHGMMIAGKEVYVAPWQRQTERSAPNKWTNVYIKNIPLEWDDALLEKVFSEFGAITSATVMRDQDGKSKGFGFVNFETHEAASQCVDDAHGWTPDKAGGVKKDKAAKSDDNDADDESKGKKEDDTDGEKAKDENEGEEEKKGDKEKESTDGEEKEESNDKDGEDGEPAIAPLFVVRAMKRSERQKLLREEFEKKRVERMQRFQGMNLYLKNLADEVDEEALRNHFAEMGTITSATVMRDEDGKSRGFGFVCMSSPEEATKAVQEKNTTMLMGKPLYVAIAQPKYIRKQQLNQRFREMGIGVFGGGAHGGPRGMAQGGLPGMVGGMPMYMGSGISPQMAMMMAGRGVPIPRGFGYPQVPGGFNMQQQGQNQGGRRGNRRNPGQRGRGPRNQMQTQQLLAQQQAMLLMQGQQGMIRPMGQMGMPQGMQMQSSQQQQQLLQQQQAQQQQQAAQAAAAAAGQQTQQQGQQQAQAQPLTPAMLAAASPEQQKNLIGERLYPLIHQLKPDQAGKVTGMLLEAMETSELINLLESPSDLLEKVKEAVDVLEAHNAKQQQGEM